ncbi:MAG: hypothetical protein Q7S57_00925 [bacterium]|nr:hypothetical protein [bacterium]
MISKTKLILSNSVLRVGLAISILGILITSGVLIFGHIMINGIIGVKNEILDLSETSTGKRYRRLTEDYNSTKSERALLFEVRPGRQDIAYFVQALDGLAARTQVTQTVEVVTQRDVASDVKYATPSIRYKLNVAGGIDSVISFMKEVNKLPYLLRVVSVQMTASQDKVLSDVTLGTIIIDIASQGDYLK